MSQERKVQFERQTAFLGLLSVAVFCITLGIFLLINPTFQVLDDYVSKLGAIGQPNALWWNLVGFALVGLMLAVFGWRYGRIRKDPLVGIFFACFGLGFAATGMPADMEDAESPLSAAHIVAICLALAFWLGGLARLASASHQERKSERVLANVAAVLVVFPMFGYLLAWWSMPMTHRLVFAVVFGWVTIASVRLLRSKGKSKESVVTTEEGPPPSL